MAETRRIEYPFPEDLEGRMNAVLNAVNTELKAVTILHLDDRTADNKEIKERIRDAVGRDQYLPQAGVIGNYCRHSFVDIGLVAREEIARDDGDVEVVGYSLTSAGKKYGRPIAAFTVTWAVQNKISIYSILGQTGSPTEIRPPLSRVKILNALYTCKQPLREIDLVDETGLSDATVKTHLEALYSIGFIGFDSTGRCERNKGFSIYEWTGKINVDEVKVLSGRSYDSTKRVARALADRRRGDCRTLESHTGIHRLKISHILSGLEKEGAARCIKWRGRDLLSEVKLLEAGEKFVEEYIRYVEKVLTDDSDASSYEKLLEGQPKSSAALVLCRAIGNYQKVSPTINRRTREKTNERIIECLRLHPGAEPADIAKRTGMSKWHARNCARKLSESGRIRKEQDPMNRSIPRYYPAFE
ncbi:ArsR family transcriptional regulator [Candidatus Woesearchaeota archaeon]|nr:ArsR family transcriptional regulator [Candidatus Woesearchaeota archaeon]